VSRNRELPFGKSPERVLEEKQEERPRQYAFDIYQKYQPHERMEQVARTVPPHLRDAVRKHIAIWTEREAKLRPREKKPHE
jgi:hypothetical protein